MQTCKLDADLSSCNFNKRYLMNHVGPTSSIEHNINRTEIFITSFVLVGL